MQQQHHQYPREKPTPPTPWTVRSQQTPQSQSSLPRYHYPKAAPSPAADESKIDDNSDNIRICYTDSNRRGTPIRRRAQSHMSPASSTTLNSNNNSDKENNIQYSPLLDNIKSRLVQNRIRRDSLQNVLSGYSCKEYESAVCPGERYVLGNKANRMSGTERTGENKRDRPLFNKEGSAKRYKVDLVPRIAANRVLKEKNPNIVRNRSETTAAISIATDAITQARNRLATAQQHNQRAEETTAQQRTQKCLFNALQIMQSKSFDSKENNSENSNNSRCSSNGSSVSSLGDPFFERLHAKLNSFKSRRELISAGSVPSCNVECKSTSSSRGGDNTINSNWIRVVRDRQNRLETASSSTFSVSPMTKGSTVIESCICSVRLDSKGNEQLDDQPAVKQQFKDTSPAAQTIDTQPTVGSYIGSVRLDSKGNEQQPTKSVPQALDKHEERGDTLSPLPPRQNSLLRAIDSPIPCINSPMPRSVANSYATSATGDTSEATNNVFDMLRNTFNNGGDDESEDDSIVEEVAATPQPKMTTMLSSSRPPLSPIPPSLSVKQSRRKVPTSQGRLTKPFGMTSKISPTITRGTPNETPGSDTGNSSILDSSVGDENDSPNRSSAGLDYSFLASALVATSMLKTPVKTGSSPKPQLSPTSEGTTTKDKPQPTTTASKRTHHELNYASIGATSSTFRTTPTHRIDPLAMAMEAETMTPTDDSSYDNGNEFLPRKKQRTPCQDDKEYQGSDGESKNTNVKSVKESSASQGILSIASALDDDSSPGTHCRESDKSKVSILEEKVKRLEESNRIPNCSSLDAYLNGEEEMKSSIKENITSNANTATLPSMSETIKLRQRVKWLEQVLGFGRGANKVFEDEINHLKEKVTILERRLDEEMSLKEEATRKVLSLTADTEARQDVHNRVEECLKQQVQDLEADLEGDKAKVKQMTHKEEEMQQQILSLQSQLEVEQEKRLEETFNAAEQQALEDKAKDEKLHNLEQTNNILLHKQDMVERELVSCARDNDKLRGRLLTIVNDASTREQTLFTAYKQLKSLSENYYEVKAGLRAEQNARRDEVSSLQLALDDMSRELLQMSTTVNTLQGENDDLKNELRMQRLEKQRSMTFHRGARGA